MASKLFSTKVIDELSKLREDLNVKSAAPKQESDMGSEALLKDLYGDIMDNTEYDVTQDPAYSSLKKTAYRESDRTMRDVLAQGNARTNGFANSAAVTAASQARDYRMSQFDDKVADLEDRALSKKNAKISAKMQLLSAIESMEATKRKNYLADLERLEQQADEEKKTAESEALNIIKMGGVPSDELLSKTGWSQEYIAAIKQNTYDSMDTASMQRYLNSQGASLAVDGAWGPKTEAAYQAVFGKPSGRQTSYGSSYSSGANSANSGSKSTSTASTQPSKIPSASIKGTIAGKSSAEYDAAAGNYATVASLAKQMAASGESNKKIRSMIKEAWNKGAINTNDYTRLYGKYR